jgi:hypothetical protein
MTYRRMRKYSVSGLEQCIAAASAEYAHDRLHDVAQHSVVGLDLILARPTHDQVRLLVQSRLGDMSKGSNATRVFASSRKSTDRKSILRSLGSSGLRRETPTTSQPAARNFAIAATPSRPLALVTSNFFGAIVL